MEGLHIRQACLSGQNAPCKAPKTTLEAKFDRNIREKPDRRDWQRQAERTVNYAFTVGGEMTIHRNQQAIRAWYALEQRRLNTEDEGLRLGR